MESFERYLLQKGYSPSSIKSYQASVLRFENWLQSQSMQASEVGYNDVLLYLKSLQQKGSSQRTQANYLQGIKQQYHYLHQHTGQIPHHPFAHLEIKGQPKRTLHQLLTLDELQSLEAPPPDEGPTAQRNRVMVSLLVNQGLNRAELERLHLDDLGLRKGKIYIRASRKTNHRTLDLKAYQIIDLQDYLYVGRPAILKVKGVQSEQLLLSMGTGKRLANTLQVLVRNLKKQHPKLQGLQQIRASVITHWLKQYNLRKVQYLCGHRYISSTEKYQIGNLDQLQNKVDRFHPLNEKSSEI